MARKNIASVVKAMEERAATADEKPKLDLLPSGCTLFNLACSGNRRGFSPVGKTINIIGDSNAGKSMLAMTILSAIFHSRGDQFDYYHDDVEKANTFNMPFLFGKNFSDALKAPPIPYKGLFPTVECFVQNITQLAASGRPFIYVLDSWDALKVESDQDKLGELVKHGKVEASYKTEKARMGSDWLGVVNTLCADSGSMVLIVSQAKANIGFGAQFHPKTRSGGSSLRYYSSIECWLAIGGQIKSAKSKMPVGTKCILKVSRSRLTGKIRTVEFPILDAYGVDDTAACVDYLMEHGVIKRRGTRYLFPSVFRDELFSSRKDLIRYIDNENYTLKLHKAVQTQWNKLEAEITQETADRPPKFKE